MPQSSYRQLLEQRKNYEEEGQEISSDETITSESESDSEDSYDSENDNYGTRHDLLHKQRTRRSQDSYSQRSAQAEINNFFNVVEDVEYKSNVKWYLIDPQNPKKFLWNMLVFLTVIQTTTMVPFRLAFVDEENSKAWVAVDMISDAIFIIDIILTFFTMTEDSEGLMIQNLKGIAIKYFKGYFLFDLISSMPISTVLYFIYQNQSRH